MIVIKKYPNRRLYNTETSSYINLDGIQALIKNGESVSIVDSKSNQDVTTASLLSHVLDADILDLLVPAELLQRLIRQPTKAEQVSVIEALWNTVHESIDEDSETQDETEITTPSVKPSVKEETLDGGEIDTEKFHGIQQGVENSTDSLKSSLQEDASNEESEDSDGHTFPFMDDAWVEAAHKSSQESNHDTDMFDFTDEGTGEEMLQELAVLSSEDDLSDSDSDVTVVRIEAPPTEPAEAYHTVIRGEGELEEGTDVFRFPNRSVVPDTSPIPSFLVEGFSTEDPSTEFELSLEDVLLSEESSDKTFASESESSASDSFDANEPIMHVEMPKDKEDASKEAPVSSTILSKSEEMKARLEAMKAKLKR